MDPIGRLRRLAIRRGWIPAAIGIALFVAVVVTATLVQPPAENLWPSYALVEGTALGVLVAFPLFLEYSLMRNVRRLAPLKSRIKEVALPLRGPMLILDNGLVLAFSRTVVSMTLLFGPSGSTLRPRVREALRWTGVRGTRRVATVVPGAAPSPVSAELEALRTRLGARLSVATVREPRRQPPLPSDPRWIATLAVFYRLLPPDPERLAPEADEVESLLRHLIRPHLIAAGPTAPAWAAGAQGVFQPIHVPETAIPSEQPVRAGLLRRFRGTAPAFQRMAVSTLVLTATTVLTGLFPQSLPGLLVFIVVVVGGGLVGASARTRKDGLAGGLIFGWAGYFLGVLILFPLEAVLQGGGPLDIGLGLLAGFVGGLFLGFIAGFVGGLAGYAGARLAKKPIRVP